MIERIDRVRSMILLLFSVNILSHSMASVEPPLRVCHMTFSGYVTKKRNLQGVQEADV